MRRGRRMTFGPKGKLYISNLGAAPGAAEVSGGRKQARMKRAAVLCAPFPAFFSVIHIVSMIFSGDGQD